MFLTRLFTRKKDRFLEVQTHEQLTAAMDASNSDPIVLYKHSSLCPLSTWARRQVARTNPELGGGLFEINVQRSPDVSFAVTNLLAIQHQTPQMIVVHHGEAIFSQSHGDIDARRIEEVLDSVPTLRRSAS